MQIAKTSYIMIKKYMHFYACSFWTDFLEFLFCVCDFLLFVSYMSTARRCGWTICVDLERINSLFCVYVLHALVYQNYVGWEKNCGHLQEPRRLACIGLSKLINTGKIWFRNIWKISPLPLIPNGRNTSLHTALTVPVGEVACFISTTNGT